MPSLAWITSCQQSACGLARALVAGYLLDLPPGDATPEDLNDLAPELSVLFNWGRVVPLEEPRPHLVRTFLLPSAEVIQYYRSITGKVVYVARDPRGIMYAMTQGNRVRPEDRERRIKQLLGSPDESLKQSDEAYANWQLHAREWTRPERVRAHFPQLEDVCVIRHEDLLTDPGAALGRIVDFLEVPGGVDGDRVLRAVENWTLTTVRASGIFEMPPGMREFRTSQANDAPHFESSVAKDVEESLAAAYQERIREDAEFAALVEQFGYAD
ncbi:sulfotransferase domain-containing protein [Streptomyces sp. NPDC050528]|uniref:sulfotransferase domain-containing protein n=1 Tax=Streptomyces sp. NPDC050528 TaxID=3365623 RepID=UPI0037BDDBD0